MRVSDKDLYWQAGLHEFTPEEVAGLKYRLEIIDLLLKDGKIEIPGISNELREEEGDLFDSEVFDKACYAIRHYLEDPEKS